MNSFTLLDQLKQWIGVHGFPDFELEEQTVKGTYGLIFFINRKGPNSSSESLALKTLDLETLPENPKTLDELQREFGNWIRLPNHCNVVGARRCKIAVLQDYDDANPENSKPVHVPVMQMERMDGSLQDWVGSDDFQVEAKLSALAQAFNGLAHLYLNGIEGHGDLKPSNILYTDIRTTQEPVPGTWLHDWPWIIKIADFGWADAWIDYGYTNKALREYLAPERLGENAHVVPEKSDVFSMGIIAAEILQGRHPAKNLKRAKTSDGEWARRANQGDWDLEGIVSERLRDLIAGCLDPDPNNRPTALESVHLVCLELKEHHGLDIEPTLQAWTENTTMKQFVPYVSETASAIHRLRRTRGLGEDMESRSRSRLRQILDELEVRDIYSFEDWVSAADTLIGFLEADESDDARSRIAEIRESARIHLVGTLGTVTHRDLSEMNSAKHPQDPLPAFQRYGHLVGGLAFLADVNFEQAYKGEWNLSPLAVAAYALYMADRSRMEEHSKRTTMDYLDIAIDESLTVSVPYFLRARRKQELLIYEAGGLLSGSGLSLKDVIDDLEIACRLAPDWADPRAELEFVRKYPFS